jgi:Mg/Co/Ni transporter MgtE
MLLVIFLGVVPGAPLPMAFQALELKPAVMTSAFPTTTTDIPGLAIYFSVAGPTLKP